MADDELTQGEIDLGARAELLATEVHQLTRSVTRLGRRQQRLAGALTAVVLVLAFTSGYLLTQIQANQRRLADVQNRTSTGVLCPLYQLFLDSYHPERRPAGTTAEQYEAQFDVIRNGYRTLGCREAPR